MSRHRKNVRLDENLLILSGIATLCLLGFLSAIYAVIDLALNTIIFGLVGFLIGYALYHAYQEIKFRRWVASDEDSTPLVEDDPSWSRRKSPGRL